MFLIGPLIFISKRYYTGDTANNMDFNSNKAFDKCLKIFFWAKWKNVSKMRVHLGIFVTKEWLQEF